MLGQKIKKFKGLELHQNCFNGVRCYRRMHKGPDVADIDEQMTQEPDEWRFQVLPLVADRSSARPKVKALQKNRSCRHRAPRTLPVHM